MTDFIRDNTTLGDDTLFQRMQNPSAHKKSLIEDWRRFRQALYDVQTYLRTGTFDVNAVLTAKDIAVTDSASPSAAPEVTLTGNRGAWFVGLDTTNAPTSRDLILAGQRGSYSFGDGVTTSGSATLTSASADSGGFNTVLVGATISGAGIPAATTVLSVESTTSLTMSANATATASAVSVTITRTANRSVVYLKHRGSLSATVGVGVNPTDGSARLQVMGSDIEPGMSALRLRKGNAQTAHVAVAHDATPADRWWIDSNFYMSGLNTLGGAIVLKGDATSNRPLLFIDKNNAASVYGYEFQSGGELRFVRTTSGTNVFQVGTNGSLFVYNALTAQAAVACQSTLTVTGAATLSSSLRVNGNCGFYNTAPVAKPTVTGSKISGAAFDSLLAALVALGLITDTTSA